jgi:hypothetical protein
MSGKPRTRIAFFNERTEQVETIWVAQVGEELYQLENIPFFFYGVSLGDVVQARWRPEDLDELEPDERPEEHGFPYFERIVRKSGNRTLRLAQEGGTSRTELLAEISRLGCSYEHFPPLLVAINVPAKVSLDVVMARLAASGGRWENGDPETAAVPGRVAYLMQAQAVTSAQPCEDRLGDLPIDNRPVCAACGRPMSAALLLRAHPRRLRFVRSAAVAIFTCSDRCEVTARLLTSAPPGGGAARVLRYTRCEEHNPWTDEHKLHHGGELVDKVGGYPQWIGPERIPRCAVCSEPMALVAQLTGELTPVGYLFVCPDEHLASFVR